MGRLEKQTHETLNCWSINKLIFDVSKKVLRLVSPPYFGQWFFKKIFLMLYSINWPNVIVWSPLLTEISGNMCIVIVYYSVCDVINFGIYLSFLIQIIFYDQKFRTQILISQKQKELIRWNKTHFSSFLKEFQLPEIVSQQWVSLYWKWI